MYRLSKQMFVLSVALMGYSLIVLSLVGGVWLFVPIAGVAFFYATKRKGRALWAHGTAAWATEEELRRAGMIGASEGLILGRIPDSGGGGPTVVQRLKTLFNHKIPAKEACEIFTAPSKRSVNGELVRLPQAVHTAVFAPTGVGKGISCVIPFLLTCEDSCIVVDFIDPFAVLKNLPFKKATFNPVSCIDKNSPTALDECNALAEALVVRTGEEKEPHWLDSAESWIAGVIATTVMYGEADEGTRSLQTVRQILSNPKRLDTAVKLMCESDAWGGMLARMGGQLMHFVDKEKSSTLTSTGRFLRFLDTLAVAESTRTSSFDPSKLRTGKMTVYLVLPPEYIHSHAGLLRMWIVSLLRAVVRGGLQ